MRERKKKTNKKNRTVPVLAWLYNGNGGNKIIHASYECYVLKTFNKSVAFPIPPN